MVALSNYIIYGGKDEKYFLSKNYIKNAEKQIKHLATLIGPNDGDKNYLFNQYDSTHRTFHEDLAVQKYWKKINEYKTNEQDKKQS